MRCSLPAPMMRSRSSLQSTLSWSDSFILRALGWLATIPARIGQPKHLSSARPRHGPIHFQSVLKQLCVAAEADQYAGLIKEHSCQPVT